VAERELTPEQEELVRLVRQSVSATQSQMGALWEQIEAVFAEYGDDELTDAMRLRIMEDINVVLAQVYGSSAAAAVNSTMFAAITDVTDAAALAPYQRAISGLKAAVERKVVGFWETTIEPLANVSSSDPLLRVVGMLNAPQAERRRILRSGELDPNRRWVNGSGYSLSDRIWRQGQDIRSKIDQELRDGIRGGRGPRTIARELETHLNPDFAPVEYTEDGRIIRRNMTLTGGSGWGSTPARRLARTEVTRVYGAAVVKSAEDVPGVKGVGWLLSASHPRRDVCDDHATANLYDLGPGVYPPGEVPTFPPHPACLCTLTRVPEDTDAFVDKLVTKYGRLMRAMELAEAYAAQDPIDLFIVRDTPPVLHGAYPGAGQNPIAILANEQRRAHLMNHQWIRDDPVRLFRILVDPDEMRRDSKKPNGKVVFYRRDDSGQLGAVVVEMKKNAKLSHSVVSAFDVRSHLENRRGSEILIWERGEPGDE